ncbi:MAG: tetratricopeptide repeat protein [Verrucomicrobia bacterium]|nr:tetratricopeptide repeat protein [Verrucomicrobiota bacterium]
MSSSFHFLKTAAVAACLFLLAGTERAPAQAEGPEELYRKGVGEFAAGNYTDAARYFKELIANFGNEPSLQAQMEGAYYAYGCSLYNLGQHADSIEAFKAYATKYPEARYRDEAQYRIAVAHQILEAWDAAVNAYKDLLAQYPRSAYAEDAAYQIGMVFLLQDKRTEAVAAFTEFMNAFPNSDYWGQAGAFIARALFDEDKMEEAIAMLRTLEQRPRSWNVVTYCNFLAFEIGDAAFEITEYGLALKAYRRVKPRAVLLRRQRETVEVLRAEVERFRREKPTPDQVQARFMRERRLQGSLAQAEELLKKLEGLPDYDAGLFHRIGRCFFNLDRYWEARVAFARVVEIAMEDKIRETAHFDLVLCLSRLRRFDDLIAEADRYLDRYDPEWKNR